MTKLFGVLGWPIGHTASPAMMAAAFAALQEDAVYLPFAVREQDFVTAVRGLAALGAVGANVTIPHKQTAWREMDEVTPEARLAQAVNTIAFDGQRLTGHNTDVQGWWNTVVSHLPDGPLRVTVFGSGGATRAVLSALSLHRPSSHVVLVARNQERAGELATCYEDYLRMSVQSWSQRHEACLEAQLLVNTTSVGMWPQTGESVIFDPGCISPGQVVQDVVYRPRQTTLLKQARLRGAVAVDGLPMLVGQGAAALEFWLRRPAPYDVMFSAAENFVAHRSEQQRDY